MTAIDPSDHGQVSQGDRWRMLFAMLVLAAAVSAYQAAWLWVTVNDNAIKPFPGEAGLFMAGFTFLSIVAYAVGFMLLSGLLDIWTGRRAQPLAAINLALPVVATLELFKVPILMAGFQIWFWATRVVS
jgi:hypothetical protein